jgi:hypothetical protein
LSWEDVIRTYHWIIYRAEELLEVVTTNINSHGILYSHYHQNFGDMFSSKPGYTSLLAILETATSMQFLDPRDRIFAFAELAKDCDDDIPVQPDYSMPFLQTYCHFAKQYLFSANGTHLLDYVRHTEESLQSTIPSWVPRWDLGPIGSFLSRGRLDDPSKLQESSTRASMLVEVRRVKGVIADTVTFVINTTNNEIATIYAETYKKWGNISPHVPVHRINAFLETLTRSTFGDSIKWRRDKAAYVLHLLQTTKQVAGEDYDRRVSEARGGDKMRAASFIDSMCPQYQFILTKRGYMGLAPHITRVGDVLAIIYGCKDPSILRKAEQKSRYQILGPAHVLSRKVDENQGGEISFGSLGTEGHQDWEEWGAKDQNIYLC